MKIIPDKFLKSTFQLSGNIENIVFPDIMQLIQKKFSAFNDKYLISTQQNLYKTKLIYSKYRVNVLYKTVKKIVFPYFKEIRAQMDSIFDDKKSNQAKIFLMPTNIIAFLEQKHTIKPFNVDTFNGKNEVLFLNKAEIDEHGNYNYEKYGVFDYFFIETCNKCGGNKYIPCENENCKGNHSWICKDCNGTGVIACNDCKQNGYKICSTCNGKGDILCIKCKGKDKDCKYCNNGVQLCISCSGKGELICDKCNGTLYNTCKTCDGTGILVCNDCFNLDEHYGKIICPECKGMGKMISLLYVEGEVQQYYKEVVFDEKYDVQNLVDVEKLYEHCNRLATSFENTKLYRPVMRASMIDDLLIRFRGEFNVKIDEYPMILQEEIYYEEIPCVKFFARNILTNTVHDVTIVDLFRNPEIIVDSDPEKVKRFDIKDTLKTGVQFIAKLLKTKQSIKKEDLQKQLFLLIYAAKADGNIAEEEKYFLVDAIGSVSQFTNKEKKEFFDLLSADNLRPLQKSDVAFSSEEKYCEVMKQVECIINSDGELHQLEQTFMDKIKQLYYGTAFAENAD